MISERYRKQLHELMRVMQCEDEAKRRSSAQAFFAFEFHAQGLQYLQGIASDHPEAGVRYQARRTLSELHRLHPDSPGMSNSGTWRRAEIETLDDLAECLGDDKLPRDSKIRLVLFAVGRKKTEFGPILTARLQVESDPYVLATLARGCGELEQMEAVPKLIELLQHEDHRVVANSIEALGALSAKADVFERIFPFLESPDNRVRANAIEALLKSNRAMAMRNLEAMSVEKRVWMRDSAALLLSRMEGPEAGRLILTMLAREDEAPIIEKLVEGAARNASVLDLEKLAEIHANARSPRKRTRTMSLLEVASEAQGVPRESVKAIEAKVKERLLDASRASVVASAPEPRAARVWERWTRGKGRLARWGAGAAALVLAGAVAVSWPEREPPRPDGGDPPPVTARPVTASPKKPPIPRGPVARSLEAQRGRPVRFTGEVAKVIDNTRVLLRRGYTYYILEVPRGQLDGEPRKKDVLEGEGAFLEWATSGVPKIRGVRVRRRGS